jgi:hypothetical protein
MKRRRSKPTSSMKGRKKKKRNALNEDVNSNQPSVEDVKEVPKINQLCLRRTNWSKGNNMIRLGETVAEWKDNRNDVSLRKFAKLKQIKLTILQRRVNDKEPIP